MLMRFDTLRDLDEMAAQRRAPGRMGMPLDAWRKGDVFHVEVDMPGVEPGGIDVTVDHNVLTVRAERHFDTGGAETVVCERPTGTFSRELFLGDNLDTERISASYQNGVIRLTIPITEAARTRRIEVTSSGKETPVATSSAG